MMRSDVFVQKAKDIAKNHKTVYANGVFGSPISESIISQKAKQLPNWYTAERQKTLRALIGKGYFGFDCVCLLKAILWGWDGDASKSYGGAVYQSNGVPDITEESMIGKCSGVSTDFSTIVPGEMLYMAGHCGIYIGDGLAVECTPKWDNGVQITAVGNIGSKSGYNSRTWLKHGKLPYVEYVSGMQTATPSTSAGSQITITLDTLRQGELRGNAQIGTAQRILKMMGYYTMDIDCSFGPGMLSAVKAFQKAKGLDADGIIGKNTWTALLK